MKTNVECKECSKKETLEYIAKLKIEADAIDYMLKFDNKTPKPKGLIIKKCPICNRTLKYNVKLNNKILRIAVYSCECGYEYGKEHFY